MSWTMPKDRQRLLDALMTLAGGRVEWVLSALRETWDLRGIVRHILLRRKEEEQSSPQKSP